MDAIVLLEDDHRTVEKLSKRFEQAGEGARKAKQELVERIIEEQVFYPVDRAAVPETEDHVLESLEEQDWFPAVRKGIGRRQLQELGDRLEKARTDAPRRPRPRAPDEPG